MNRQYSILFGIVLMFSSSLIHGQGYQWATSLDMSPYAEVVAIRESTGGEFYVATVIQDSLQNFANMVVKYNAERELLQGQIFHGNAHITDIETDENGNLFGIGYFSDTLFIDTAVLHSGGDIVSGFIFKRDSQGVLIWAHAFNPVESDFTPVNLYVSAGGSLYCTSDFHNATYGFCAFHQFNGAGILTRNEFNNNHDNRTFTHIVADAEGSVYLSGTCGNQATFDSLTPPSQDAYQNFLVKYDSSFTARWIRSRSYATFDHGSSLGWGGEHLYWAFDQFTGNVDTTHVVVCDTEGTIMHDVKAPLGNAFLPFMRHVVGNTGESTLLLRAHGKIFLYRYDAALQLVWQDSILFQSIGSSGAIGLHCNDEEFYVLARYYGDALQVGNLLVVNPNADEIVPADLCVFKWSSANTTAARDENGQMQNVRFFPNPFSESLAISKENKYPVSIRIYNMQGHIIYSGMLPNDLLVLDTSGWIAGAYVLCVNSEEGHSVSVAVRW